jgi:DNA-binding SARP family transcriptional activator
MRYEILGPVRVIKEGGVEFVRGRNIEAVLIALVIRADQVVTFDELVMEVWGDRPPRRATAAVHVYISQLRKLLARAEKTDSPIITQTPGYLLHQGSDEIDFKIFLRHLNESRLHMSAGHYEEASRSLEMALQLWRGPALADAASGPIATGCASFLLESRLECWETLSGAQLELGKHRELIGQLSSLIEANPLREIFYQQLMLALYRSDRQADALRVYQKARRILQDELGVDPCPRLRDLHHAILSGSSALALR